MSLKDKSPLTPQERYALSIQIGRVVDNVHATTLALGYVRYEKLRLLNPRQFSELCARNLAGEGTFDDLVDQLQGQP